MTVSREEKFPAAKQTKGIFQVPIQVIVDEKTSWAKVGEIKAQVDKASKIFKQCNIEIGEVTVRYMNVSPKINEVLSDSPSPYKAPQELMLAKQDITTTRPAVFLLSKSVINTAKAFTRHAVTQLSRSTTADLSPMLHLSIISDNHRTNEVSGHVVNSYSNFAHELAHILGNLEHTEENDNLMANSPKIISGRLNAEQCKQISDYTLSNFSSLKSTEPDCDSP